MSEKSCFLRVSLLQECLPSEFLGKVGDLKNKLGIDGLCVSLDSQRRYFYISFTSNKLRFSAHVVLLLESDWRCEYAGTALEVAEFEERERIERIEKLRMLTQKLNEKPVAESLVDTSASGTEQPDELQRVA